MPLIPALAFIDSTNTGGMNCFALQITSFPNHPEQNVSHQQEVCFLAVFRVFLKLKKSNYAQNKY